MNILYEAYYYWIPCWYCLLKFKWWKHSLVISIPWCWRYWISQIWKGCCWSVIDMEFQGPAFTLMNDIVKRRLHRWINNIISRVIDDQTCKDLYHIILLHLCIWITRLHLAVSIFPMRYNFQSSSLIFCYSSLLLSMPQSLHSLYWIDQVNCNFRYTCGGGCRMVDLRYSMVCHLIINLEF